MEQHDTALVVRQEHAVATSTPFLMTGALVRQKLKAQKEMSEALIEYMQGTMERGKHYYYMSDLAKGGENDSDRDDSKRRKADEKPALTQDGARALSTLFEVYPEASLIEEIPLAEGHVRIRTTVVLKGYDGRICGQGIGTCSTRESRYAYRWMFEDQVPEHLDKRSLPTRKSRNGRYTFFRVPNEDIEDVMNTVTKMSFKRAHVMAVQSLPCVSDAFEANEGEDDEEKRKDTDEAREHEATLAAAYAILREIPRGRTRAVQQIFGVDRMNGLPTLSLEALKTGLGRLRAVQEAGHDWEHGDLKATEQRHAEKSTADLFGDAVPKTPGQQATRKSAAPPARKEAVAELETLLGDAESRMDTATASLEDGQTLSDDYGRLQHGIDRATDVLRDPESTTTQLKSESQNLRDLLESSAVGVQGGQE